MGGDQGAERNWHNLKKLCVGVGFLLKPQPRWERIGCGEEPREGAKARGRGERAARLAQLEPGWAGSRTLDLKNSPLEPALELGLSLWLCAARRLGSFPSKPRGEAAFLPAPLFLSRGVLTPSGSSRRWSQEGAAARPASAQPQGAGGWLPRVPSREGSGAQGSAAVPPAAAAAPSPLAEGVPWFPVCPETPGKTQGGSWGTCNLPPVS